MAAAGRCFDRPSRWTGLETDSIRVGFTPLRWHRTYEDYLKHFSTYVDVAGDNPCNLAATAMPFQAYLYSGEERYRDWILEYVDAGWTG